MSLLLLLNGSGGGAAPALVMPAGASAIVGTTKVKGWSGNCCRVKRISDGAELDIGWNGAYWDSDAIINHAGASTCRIIKFYDMSGSGNDYTVASDARAPFFSEARKWGNQYGATAFDASKDYFVIPNSVAINRQAATVYDVCAAQAYDDNTTVWGLNTSWENGLALLPRRGSVVSLTSAGFTTSGVYSNTQPEVKVMTSSASGRTVHVNNQVSSSLPSVTNTSMTGGFWGQISLAQYTYYGEMFFHAVYPAAHDTATIQDVKDQLYDLYDIPTSVTKQILFMGDSLTWGQGEDGYPVSRLLRDSIGSDVDIRNIGVPGMTATTMAGSASAILDGYYKSSYTHNVLVLGAGSNDIQNNRSAADIYSDINSIISAANTDGYYTILWDVIARGSFDTTKEAVRTTLNSTIATNTASANATIAASSTFDDETDSTYYNSDQTHLKRAGYEVMRNLFLPSVQAGLGIS